MFCQFFLIFALLSAAVLAYGQPVDEEIVVTAPFSRTTAETTLPVGTLDEKALRREIASSLGETLKNQLGVHNATFGSGVGQPVIRGQSGKRVQVLQNSVAVSDAAGLSPDHANGVEPILAKRIEIVRGPATLLYGSGAIGGVINVIDQRIPDQIFEHPELLLEQSHASVNDEDKSLFGLHASKGTLSLHADFFDRRSNAVNIPGFALSGAVLEAAFEESRAHGEAPPVKGVNPNSNGYAQGGTLGVSKIFNQGFVGLSISELASNYGLPAGLHGHGEEALVRIALKQRRVDLKSAWFLDGEWLQSFDFHLGYTDYGHRELELEGDETELGTEFSNHGVESRMTIGFGGGAWNGVLGLQWEDTRFSASGEEAFIPATDVQNTALFLVQQFDAGALTAEIGARIERDNLDPGQCGKSANLLSASASGIYEFREDVNLTLGIARSERAPTVEERFSNLNLTSCEASTDLVLHAATNLFEVGLPDLDEEVSTNLEFGYRKHQGDLALELSAFVNRVDDYIFVQLEPVADDSQPEMGFYRAKDADFRGLELSVDYPLLVSDVGSLNLGLSGDLVRARFRKGGNVPRIPPIRGGISLEYEAAHWTLSTRVTRYGSAKHLASVETGSQGYVLWEAYGDYRWSVKGQGELVLFARGNNLLDETIRSQVSFLKDVAPEAGRSIRLGLRYRWGKTSP